jgi:hypothetical protein
MVYLNTCAALITQNARTSSTGTLKFLSQEVRLPKLQTGIPGSIISLPPDYSFLLCSSSFPKAPSGQSWASFSLVHNLSLLRSKYTNSRCGKDKHLQWNNHDRKVYSDFAFSAQCSPVWLDIHIDVGPLTGPAFQGVSGV